MFDFKKEFETNGVVKIPAVFTKSEMDLARRDVWENYRAIDGSQIQYRDEFPAIMFLQKRCILDNICKDKRMIDIVKTFLGENILQLNKQVYFRLPGDGDQFGWHQDLCFRVPREKFYGIETAYLQTAIVIDDMTEENGAIEYVIGSHKWGEFDLVPRNGSEKGLRSFNRKEFEGTKVLAKSGDVLLWSVMIVHGSEKNTSTHSRMYVMNGLARDDSVDASLGFPHYMKNGVAV